MIPAQMIPGDIILGAEPLPERERLAARRVIRLQLAELEVLGNRRREITALIAAIDRELDAATDKHQAKCAPIQSELAVIQEAQIREVADRATPDEKLEARRLELLAERDAANEELAIAAHRAEQKRKPLGADLRKATPAPGSPTTFTLEGKLVHLGRPDLIDEYFAESCERWFARQRVELAEGQIRGRQRGESHRKWSFELERATARLATATAECDRLRREIIDE